jgi:hypothetical protein
LDDGLAEAAGTQAKLWAQAAEENAKNGDTSNAAFVKELLTMTSKMTNAKKAPAAAGAQKKGGTGALGQQTRVQPRDQKPGMAQQYDAKVKATVNSELTRKKARAADAANRLKALTSKVAGVVSDNAKIDGAVDDPVCAGGDGALIIENATGMIKVD